MTIHPSLIEKASLDAREFNADVAADIKRSFAYVGPMTVGSHEPVAADGFACNEMRLIVRMGKPYWRDEDAGGTGAELWVGVSSWLAAKAYKVSSTMSNFNTSRAEAGSQTVCYDRVELDMKPYVLGIALGEGDGLPALNELAGRFRALLNAGVIPSDAAGVEMPSAASLEAQRAAVVQALAERQVENEASAREGGASDADGAEVASGAADDGEAHGACTGEAAPDAFDGGEATGACDAAGANGRQSGASAIVHASDGLTALDYALWDVRLADGSVRSLDSVTGMWL
ncbi:MAG: hypothetical protein KHY83_10145 [Coriobacteriia bacterium]|nr:hypothetical protein [Coriobacteriia bacterium]MBS5479009.1 hypothetical protein [Coriobacteriia bacterium]